MHRHIFLPLGDEPTPELWYIRTRVPGAEALIAPGPPIRPLQEQRFDQVPGRELRSGRDRQDTVQEAEAHSATQGSHHEGDWVVNLLFLIYIQIGKMGLNRAGL